MNQILSIADLALKYGTINKKQFDQLIQLYHDRKKSKKPQSQEQLMIGLKLATGYQVGLLKLIREYQVIKKKGEAFGKIAVEKGYATRQDVHAALEVQKKEFKRAKIKKLIGDIMVETGVITIRQKNEVLAEQKVIEKQADEILSDTSDKDLSGTNEVVDLTQYEKQFLKIKALDDEFAATLLEKNLATKNKIRSAQKIQEEAFEKSHDIRILGDIMVELNFLSEEQKIRILKEQDRIDDAADIRQPFTIEIASNQMEAHVQLKDTKEKIDLNDLKAAIESKGISHGIYPDSILKCYIDSGSTRFLCAKQDYSIQLIKQKKTTYHFTADPISTEEFKKGAALAQMPSANETYFQTDIFGKQSDNESMVTFRCGTGVRLSKDQTKAFAGKTGFPSLSVEGKLFIHPPISILEDADLRYGPLEPYANLSISGTLTGAYPVTAGHIKAREIRGANITAIGHVESSVGITNAVISAQGDIKARYLHNCRIETFGDVIIENEIIDSQIFCGGKIKSPNCHIISSELYAKSGIEISGAGSSKTNPCIIAAGTEHQVVERLRKIDLELQNIRMALDRLIEKKDIQMSFSKKTFRRMVELKIFHDRAKKKKEKLTSDFNLRKKSLPKEKLNNIAKLIHNFEKRKAASVSSLKEFNKIKKRYDKEAEQLDIKIQKLKPRIEKDSCEFEIDASAFLEHAKRQRNLPQIKCNKEVYAGTILSGTFSSVVLEQNKKSFFVFEKQTSKNQFDLVFQKN